MIEITAQAKLSLPDTAPEGPAPRRPYDRDWRLKGQYIDPRAFEDHQPTEEQVRYFRVVYQGARLFA